MGGVSSSGPLAADSRRRRALSQQSARRFTGCGDGGGTEIGTVQAVFGSARETDGPALLEHTLKDSASARESEIHATLRARASRPPLAIARVLAAKYPQSPIVSYIPSVAWANTLRLADATKDNALQQKVVNETRPWLSGAQPLFGERIALTAVAGTFIYAELAQRGEQAARPLAIQGADEALKVAAPPATRSMGRVGPTTCS